jgi:chorismate mutase
MKKINKLRKKIDKIDSKISKLLLKRKKYTKLIGENKKTQGIAIINKSREKEIVSNIKNKTKNKEEQKYLLDVYNIILKNSRNTQK